MLLIYTLIFYCLLPVILLRLLWRSIQSPQYRQRWVERFGFVAPVQSPVIWLHSVSVGETIASEPLVRALLKQYPNFSLWITTTTPTGSNQVTALYVDEMAAGRLHHSYIPYDLPDCVQRFIRRVQPKVAVFMETELWPNILTACEKKHIPTLLVNARLSARSLKGYQRFHRLSYLMFSKLTAVVAQTVSDAERIQSLGALSAIVSGSLKSEISISDTVRQQAIALKKQWSLNGQRQVIIAASTHQGEDEIILSAYQSCLEKHKDLLLILVPRHPERFKTVEQLCLQRNLIVQSRSDQQPINPDTQLVLGDTMGELVLLYGASDIAIVAGSFIEHGGHNMLEPAAWGLPIVSGNSVFNFAQIADDMVKNNALIIAESEQELLVSLNKLISEKQFALSLGQQAQSYVEKNRGALAKTVSAIHKYLS